ncbi:MAG: energy-coupling factor transporter transmembrane component T family protein [Promethearchaeota archaeon]
MGIVQTIIHHFSEFMNVEKKVKREGTSVHPSLKIVLLFVLLVLVAQFYSINNLAILLLTLLIITFVIGGYSKLFFGPMILLFSFAAITTALIILVRFDEFKVAVETFTLESLYKNDLLGFLVKFNMRISISLWLSRLLLFTTPISELLQGLRTLRIPRVFVNLFAISFRYIFLLAGEFTSINIARELRSPEKLPFKERFKALGNVYAALLNRALKRSENIYIAMSFRGETSNFISKRHDYSPWKSVAFALGFVGLILTNIYFS